MGPAWEGNGGEPLQFAFLLLGAAGPGEALDTRIATMGPALMPAERLAPAALDCCSATMPVDRWRQALAGFSLRTW